MIRRVGRVAFALILVLSLFVIASCATTTAQPGTKAFVADKDTLSLWTDDAPAKKELIEYLEAVTDPSNPDYIPLEKRIAVFDFDGTLFCETDPNYFDFMMLVYHVLEDPLYKDKASDYEKEVAQMIVAQNETGSLTSDVVVPHGKAVASSFKGFTLQQFNDYVLEFKTHPMPSYNGMNRGDGFYLPMIQVVDLLVNNGFIVYVFSGTDTLIVRGLFQNSALSYLPNAQIIGSDMSFVATNQGDTDGLEYTFQSDDQVLIGGEFLLKDLKMNKVSKIVRHVGEQPVLAFGNTSSDFAMAEYTVSNNKYRSLGFMLCCDDLERENGNLSKAEKMVNDCAEHGWIAISMKNDWTTIYGDKVTKK